MLKSLFGELGAIGASRSAQDARPGDFAATAILETRSSEVSEHGRLVDRHTQDLFVSGSPADAMRQHLAAAAASETDGAPARVVTLYDPARMWAGAVVKALSDASGQAIERLHLRDQATLATLAMIERTTLPRRDAEPLKVYHADMRDATPEGASVPVALMEHSDLTAAIIGPMHSAMVDAMLAFLLGASRAPQWRCPTLLFLLPVGAPWIERKIRSVPWPRALKVQCVAKPLSSASAVWNLLLEEWSPPAAEAPAAAEAASSTPPAAAAAATAYAPDAQPAAPLVAAEPLPAPLVRDISRREPDELTVLRAMREIMQPDGVLGAALVNATHGTLIAAEGGGTLDLELAAAAASDLMRAHQRSQRYFAPSTTHGVEEVVMSTGPRQVVLRTIDAHPTLFLLVVADRQRAPLDVVRARASEVQRMLV